MPNGGWEFVSIIWRDLAKMSYSDKLFNYCSCLYGSNRADGIIFCHFRLVSNQSTKNTIYSNIRTYCSARPKCDVTSDNWPGITCYPQHRNATRPVLHVMVVTIQTATVDWWMSFYQEDNSAKLIPFVWCGPLSHCYFCTRTIKPTILVRFLIPLAKTLPFTIGS